MPAAMKAAAAAALQPAEGHAFESRLWRLHLEQRNRAPSSMAARSMLALLKGPEAAPRVRAFSRLGSVGRVACRRWRRAAIGLAISVAPRLRLA